MKSSTNKFKEEDAVTIRFHSLEEPTYDELLEKQIRDARKVGADDLKELLLGTEHWTVDG